MVPRTEPSRRALTAALSLCLALPAMASLAASNWVWGLDVLAAWPLAAAAALVALGASGFVPPLAQALERALAALGRAWERHRLAGDALAAALVAALVVAVRDPLQFTGDHSLRVGAIGLDRPLGRLFPQAFPLDLAINLHMPRALAGLGFDPADAIRLVGAAVAAVFALAVMAFVRALGARGAALPAAALILLAGGYVAHFAGYDKFGPLLLGIVLAATGAVRLEREGRGAAWLAAGTIMCLLASRLGYAVVPAALVSVARGWRVGHARGAVGLAAGAMLVAAIVMLPRTLEIMTGLDRATHLPGGGQTITRGSPDAPDALVRLTDGANLLFLLVPLWPAGLVAAILMRRRSGAGRRASGGLAAVTIAALALHLAILIAIRARQGTPRDWDAYAGVALVVALATAGALVAFWTSTRPAGLVAPAVTISLAAAAAFWGLQGSERMMLRRIETMLAGRPAWSEPARAAAYDYLGVHALRLGRYDEASERFAAALAIAPNPRFFYQAGLGHLGAGRLDRAESLFTVVRARVPHNSDPLVGLAQVALARGDTSAAVARLDSALALMPDHPAAELRRELRARGR